MKSYGRGMGKVDKLGIRTQGWFSSSLGWELAQ